MQFVIGSVCSSRMLVLSSHWALCWWALSAGKWVIKFMTRQQWCVARLSCILACSSAKFPGLPCLALIAHASLKRWACAGCLRAGEEIQAWWKLVEALPCDLTIMVLHELFDTQPDLSSRFKFNLRDQEDQHVYSCQLWVRQTQYLTSLICFASSD